MTDILTNSVSIPYNTWGGGVPQSKASQASRSLTISAGEVPYNYTPLTSNLYISSDLTNVEPIPLIMNMADYASFNIANYNTITSIPEDHSPNSINTSLAQDWSYAFYKCENLTSLPDPFYDTSNATNMKGMIRSCKNLTTIPNFDTNNVTDMDGMFSYCNNITTIPNYNTTNVTNMSATFSGCHNLTTIPNFDTSNVTNMRMMFSSCKNLTTIPNFDTSNVTNMDAMFEVCYNLTTVPNFDTNNVTDMHSMFYECYNLITIPNYNTTNVTSMEAIFSGCHNLTTIPNFDTSNVTDMSKMFGGYWDACRNLTAVPNFDTSNVTNMANMFGGLGQGCEKLVSIPNFNTRKVVNMSYMFGFCSNLTTVPNFDTSNVTNMANMFNGCRNLTTVPNFDTSNVTDMSSMFSYCDLDILPILNITKVINISNMFYYCSSNNNYNFYVSSNNISNASRLFYDYKARSIKNIYCHVNTTTYNSIYSAMGNNTYNSNWNTYLKTFENDPIGSISQIDSIQIDFIPDGEIYQNTAIFRSPVNTCAVCISAPDNRTLLTGPNFKLDPYIDYNIKVEFVAPTTSPTDPVDPESLATPMNLQVYAISNTSNICIANSSGSFLANGMNTIDIYINGYYPKTGDPEPNINICNIN